LRVGCSASILDAPVEMALARSNYQGLGVNLNWVQCPPCAGAVVSMLSAGLVDMALMHTEDFVAFAADGNALRACGTFVATPRTWGLFVNHGSGVSSSADMRGGTVGMPDDKGATLTLSVFGETPGWGVLLYCSRRPFNSLRKAASAMARDLTRVTLWERSAASHAMAACEWAVAGEVSMPWPALLLVASKEALYAKSGSIKRFIRFARSACQSFMVSKEDQALAYLSARYGMSPGEASAVMASTDWLCESKVDVDAIIRPFEHLKKTGLIAKDRVCDPARFVAKGMCTLTSMVDELHAPPPSPRKVLEEEDFEDFGFLAEPMVADFVVESDRTGAEQFVVKGGEDYGPVPAG